MSEFLMAESDTSKRRLVDWHRCLVEPINPIDEYDFLTPQGLTPQEIEFLYLPFEFQKPWEFCQPFNSQNPKTPAEVWSKIWNTTNLPKNRVDTLVEGAKQYHDSQKEFFDSLHPKDHEKVIENFAMDDEMFSGLRHISFFDKNTLLTSTTKPYFDHLLDRLDSYDIWNYLDRDISGFIRSNSEVSIPLYKCVVTRIMNELSDNGPEGVDFHDDDEVVGRYVNALLHNRVFMKNSKETRPARLALFPPDSLSVDEDYIHYGVNMREILDSKKKLKLPRWKIQEFEKAEINESPIL